MAITDSLCVLVLSSELAMIANSSNVLSDLFYEGKKGMENGLINSMGTYRH